MAGVVGFLLSAFLLVAPLLVHTQPDGFRASLLRKNATLDLSLAAERSRRRLSSFTGSRLARVDLDYVIELAIGTPPVTVQAEVDTRSDLSWVRRYDRTKSKSFSPLPCASQFCQALPETFRVKCTAAECGYRYPYGATEADYPYTQGVLGTETFMFGNDAVPGVAFGCSDTIYGSNFGYGGLVGLGRSDLSLVGQLRWERFSYCLSSNLQVPSPIRFGSAATLTGGGIFSTPLLHDVHYYVNLLGISVGGSRLPIPEGTFALDPQTRHGGVAFDSGAPATMLVEPAYSLVLRAFKEQMPPAYKAVNGSQFGLDLDVCFLVDTSQQQQAALPSMTMHFEGLDMKLQPQNYLRPADQRGTRVCLMIGRSETISLVGNYMQMDFHLLYDLKNSALSMQRADCSKVAPTCTCMCSACWLLHAWLLVCYFESEFV